MWSLVLAQDGAEPSANSTSVSNLLRLASFTGEKHYQEKAQKVIAIFETHLTKMPLALPEMVSGFITYLTPTKQVSDVHGQKPRFHDEKILTIQREKDAAILGRVLLGLFRRFLFRYKNNRT